MLHKRIDFLSLLASALCLLACLAALSAPALAGSGDRPEPKTLSPMPEVWIHHWREDLAAARAALEERHPNVFHTVSAAELDAAFSKLSARLPQLQHHEVIVELARIVALVGDGHTRLTLPLGPGVEFEQGHSSTPPPARPEMQFHQLPVRLAIDGDGPWIERTTPEHRDLVGARLLAIGGQPIDRVIDAVSPTIRRDNEMQVLYHLPMHLVLPEILHACGVLASPQRAELTLRLPFHSGPTARRHVLLEPLPFDEPVEWVGLPTTAGEATPTPLSVEDEDRNYALHYLADRDAIYLAFNVVYDAVDPSIRDLSVQLTDLVARPPGGRPVNKLILDLRRNRGGDTSLVEPLLRALVASPLNETGHLFVLIGRATFSAAMNFALLLEKHTEVLFVGEPTGARPNSYGDSRKVRLPHSGLTLRVSTLYWQSHPRDQRPWIAPQLPLVATADDVLAGRDPVLETVLALSPPAGGVPWAELRVWQGELRTGSGAFPWSLALWQTPSGWQGSADVPAFGLEEARAEELRIEPAGLSFALTVQEGPVRFSGHALGDRLYGHADLGSHRLGFFLATSDGQGGGAPSAARDSRPAPR